MKSRYLWQLIQQEKITNEKNIITISDRRSIFEVVGKNKIDIFYRFEEIFKSYVAYKGNLLYRNEKFDEKSFEYLENEVFHILGELDLLRGISEKWYINTVIKENLLKFVDLSCFNEKQIDLICDYYYKIKQIGNNTKIFIEVLKDIFGRVKFYYMDKKVLIVIDKHQDSLNLKKYKALEDIFLDLTVKVRVFWKYPFGIIGENETMLINSIEIY